MLQSWYRQADDTFTFIHKDHIIPFHLYFNSIHPDIQWTYEIKKEGRINMLDLTIIKDKNGSLSFEVYRNPHIQDST
jgi:alkyl hydroperoxide reductase subunit AhpC